MANLENMKFELVNKTETKAKFKTTFRIKQNPKEKRIEELKWRCKYRLHGVDPGGVRVPLFIGPFIEDFGPSSNTYIDCVIEISMDRKYLDEDFFYKKDEICMKLSIDPMITGLVKDSDYTNWIREEFGTWFSLDD